MTVSILRQGVSEILKGLELDFQGDRLGYHSTMGRGTFRLIKQGASSKFSGRHCTGGCYSGVYIRFWTIRPALPGVLF